MVGGGASAGYCNESHPCEKQVVMLKDISANLDLPYCDEARCTGVIRRKK